MSGVFVRSEDRTLALEGGADGYLTKPVEPQEVIATVKSLLRVRKAEEAARQAAYQWQATFDARRDALCLLNPAGEVLRCNRAMVELLRQPVGDLLGRPCVQLLRGALGASAEALIALLAGPLPQSAEVQLGDRSFHVTLDPVINERGDITGTVLLLDDVTQRNALADQLRQAQKMEAVGRLAGGIAHDFNNLLTAITGNLALLLARTAADDPSREMLQMTENAAWRAAELTRQLLGFSRQARLWLKPLSLPVCLQESMTILQRTLGRFVEVELVSDPDVWLVQADPNQMNQVLMNLCLNARDAMPTGGRIVASIQNRVLTPEYACAAPGGPARRIRGAVGARSGRGHSRGDPAAHLRPVLHDQGAGPRHRPGVGDGVRHRQAAPGLDRMHQQGRRGHLLHDLPAPLSPRGMSARIRPESSCGTPMRVGKIVRILRDWHIGCAQPSQGC